MTPEGLVEKLRQENDYLIDIIRGLLAELPRLTCTCGKLDVINLQGHAWECRYRWLQGDIYERAEAAIKYHDEPDDLQND